MVKYPWYPCELCGTTGMVEYIPDKPRRGRTTVVVSCPVCGWCVSHSISSELIDNSPPTVGIAPERRGHYDRVVCLYCGIILTGRKKLFCSHRCRMRYKRKAHKTSQKPVKNHYFTKELLRTNILKAGIIPGFSYCAAGTSPKKIVGSAV